MTHPISPAHFWDEVHADSAAQPPANPQLISLTAALPAGRALDLGCGGGGDALWLAGHGWTVTAADLSAGALAALRRRARASGSAARITALRHDLAHGLPAGRFDLISAHYLHTPFALDRIRLFRQATAALQPGGHLLIVDHGSSAPWSWDREIAAHAQHPAELAAELALPRAQWATVRAETSPRTASGPDGTSAEVLDHVLLIRRLPT